MRCIVSCVFHGHYQLCVGCSLVALHGKIIGLGNKTSLLKTYNKFTIIFLNIHMLENFLLAT